MSEPKKTRYCVFMNIDINEWDYLRADEEEGKWANYAPVRLFDTYEEAEKVAKTFNTATVEEFKYEPIKGF